MKHLLLIVLMLGTSFFSFGQSIVDKTKFMYALMSTTNPMPGIILDTLKITYQSNDSLSFEVLTPGYGKHRMMKVSDKVYWLNATDTVCLYDYSLQAGDSFFVKDRQGEIDTLLLDSVASQRLLDGNWYKHWYFKSKYKSMNPTYCLVWRENLGTGLGWNYSDFKQLHRPGIAAICLNSGKLIQWSLEKYMSFSPGPTCYFDSVRTVLSLPQLKNNRLQVYPNPANAVLFIDAMFDFQYRIFDAYGRLVSSGIGKNQIELETLKPGVYFLILQTENKIFRTEFMKA